MIESCILQVEDDANDVFFLRRAFDQAGILNPLHVVQDGQAAIDYLSGSEFFEDREQYPVPCLVLLDLKLPRKSGIEVLRWIRQQPSLRSMIVVVLSSSAQPQDMSEAYATGANAFVVKPSSVDERIALAKAIKAFWLTYNSTPGGSCKRGSFR